MGKSYKWGIMGTGTIANSFVKGLNELKNANLYAVASRSMEKAGGFAEKYGAAKAYGSYEELVRDPEIDIIYVATPNTTHKENMQLCLNNGKAVLCEKPFTINASEAEEVIRLAGEKKLFLMEAMWSRFFPVLSKVREWLDKGLIGEVRMVTADFGFRREGTPEDRKVSPDRGGGALLDVGVYPISFASMVFCNTPSKITGITSFFDTGVDQQSSMLLGYSGAQMAILSCAINLATPKEARIMGTKGMIRIPEYPKPSKAILSLTGEEPVTAEVPVEGNGYNYEASAVMECMEKGGIEHPLMPLDETVSILRVMDELRRQWGLSYPSERLIV